MTLELVAAAAEPAAAASIVGGTQQCTSHMLACSAESLYQAERRTNKDQETGKVTGKYNPNTNTEMVDGRQYLTGC
jgi:hypothetical protein